MKWTEMIKVFNGVGCPIFSLSWTPPKLEAEVAHKVIVYLEDRRVLYKRIESLTPIRCEESVLKIREFLTTELTTLRSNAKLGPLLRSMRHESREFLDRISFHKSQNGLTDSISPDDSVFIDSIRSLRTVFGNELVKLFLMYGLDCEGDLLTILPNPKSK